MGAALEKLVVDVAGEIRDLAFWNKGCHEPDYEYCKLREGMGGRKGLIYQNGEPLSFRVTINTEPERI